MMPAMVGHPNEAPAADVAGPFGLRSLAERFSGFQTMDISRAEQRILHLLAQGGRIDVVRDDGGSIAELLCVSRDGWLYSDFDIRLFRKLKRKRAIASSKGRPYRITMRGLALVRSQADNR